MPTTTQLRGHCQACGRLQAVTRGWLAKHGYRIADRGNYGWFAGTCGGSGNLPLEADSTIARARIGNARDDAAKLNKLADALRSGAKIPETVQTTRMRRDPTTGRYEPVLKPWSEATEHERAHEVERLVHQAEAHAWAADNWAFNHAELVERVHGQPLQEVKRAEAPAPILSGETRRSDTDVVLTATGVDRGNVYWRREDNGKRGRMSTRAWRLLPAA